MPRLEIREVEEHGEREFIWNYDARRQKQMWRGSA